MDKVVKDRFVVRNDEQTFVNVELLAERPSGALIIPPEEEELELELEDIDILQIRDSALAFLPVSPADEPPPESRAQQQRKGSSRTAMVLYPERPPRPPSRDTEALEKIISTIPATPPARKSLMRRAISYAAVAIISILGTVIFIGNRDTPHAQILSDITLTSAADGAAGDPSPAAPMTATHPTRPDLETTPEPSGVQHREPASAPAEARPSPAEARAPSPIPPLAEPTVSQARSAPPRGTGNPPFAARSAAAERTGNTGSTTGQVAAAQPERTPLPTIPSKETVRRTLAALAPEVQRCKGGVSGRVVIELAVSGASGRVISAKAIDQIAVGATAGRCAAHAVEKALFPRFEKPELVIKYPFDL